MTDARIAKMLDWAKHQEGYREGFANGHWDNIEKFVNDPGMQDLRWAQGQPWCAIFASDAALHAGLEAHYPHTASVNAAYAWFKQHGYVSEYPAIGAWVMYGTSLSNLEHVGICDGFTTVNESDLEGNTNATGSPEGYEVMQKVHQRRDPWVRIYGYPPGIRLESADPVYNHRMVAAQPPNRVVLAKPPTHIPLAPPAWRGPRGIDLSSYQGVKVGNRWEFHPPKLSFTPDFGFVKTTEMYRDKNGRIVKYVNPVAHLQIEWLRSLHAEVGVYFYGHPTGVGTTSDEQVAFFLAESRPLMKPGDAIVYDWEEPHISGAIKDHTLHLLQTDEPKRRVLLYCNIDFWLNKDTTSQCGDGLYLADPSHPVGHPGVKHPVLFQQHGVVDGVDADYAIGFKTRAAMNGWWWGKSPVKPAKRPTESVGIPAKPVAPPVATPKIDTAPPPVKPTPRAVTSTPVQVAETSWWQKFLDWFRGLG